MGWFTSNAEDFAAQIAERGEAPISIKTLISKIKAGQALSPAEYAVLQGYFSGLGLLDEYRNWLFAQVKSTYVADVEAPANMQIWGGGNSLAQSYADVSESAGNVAAVAGDAVRDASAVIGQSAANLVNPTLESVMDWKKLIPVAVVLVAVGGLILVVKKKK